MDKGFNKYDPHMIAETKMNAIVNYREKKREFKSLQKKLKEAQKKKIILTENEISDLEEKIETLKQYN